MFYSFRNIFALTYIVILFTSLSNAQPRKGKFINIAIGYGLSAPYEDVEVTGSGFYAQGEYILGISKWFGLRPYAGIIITSPDKNPDFPDYKVTTNAFLFGGKARFCAPIPWIAPYFELGLGGSIGSFETHTPNMNKKGSGLVTHIPFSLGLALGPKHNFEFAFTYYFHPAAEQFAGAAAFGVSFPIE